MRKLIGWSIAVLMAVAVLAVVAVPQLRWRAHLVVLAAAGKIPDMEWSDLLSFMSPSSEQSVTRLIDTRNPYPVIRNPNTSTADIDAGAKLFQAQCSICHATGGSGSPRGPALFGRAFSHGTSDWAVFRTIRYGVLNTAMQPFSLLQAQLWQLVAYISTLEAPGGAQAVSAASHPSIRPVQYEEIRALRQPADEWLTYSGSYSSIRHSALAQIGPHNVDQLAVRWIYQFPEQGRIEASPIVRSGRMFVTTMHGQVIALETASGKRVWQFDRGKNVGVNRGVAILGDRLFVATTDTHLIALSAENGALQWQAKLAEHKEGYFFTSAPLVVRDLVVIGITVQPLGRGFIAAYDASTGKERWRFHTIPAPGEPGHETWEGESWRTGGASAWLTGSYDPEEDLLYWGVGNPKPDYDETARKGDNLYTNSVVALRGSTGKLVWHFQFSPGDAHDWDSAQIPVIADRKTSQGVEKRLLWANRNGFYYVLDRISGHFLAGTPYVRQNWAERLDERGRPVRRLDPGDAKKGVLTYPGGVGGTNWWSPTYDPVLDQIFVPVLEQGMVFFPNDASGSTISSAPRPRSSPLYTAVRALEAGTGKLIWEHRSEPRFVDAEMGGLLSTRTGILFGGDQSTFFALDSKTGKLLWSFATGGQIAAAPVTYLSAGE